MTIHDCVGEFERAVREHDILYAYSTDPAVRKAGEMAYWNICLLAMNLSPVQAANIWNAEVQRKVSESYQQDFFWLGWSE